jgi:hypothetical protein
VALCQVLHLGRFHLIKQLRYPVNILIKLLLLRFPILVFCAERPKDPELFNFAGEREEFLDGGVL